MTDLYLFHHIYRPQTEVWGKVIFSEAYVKNSVMGGAWSQGVWSWGVPGPRGAWSQEGHLVLRGCLVWLGGCLVWGVSKPTTKGEVEGDLVQAHNQGESWGDLVQAHNQGEFEGDLVQAHTQGGRWGDWPGTPQWLLLWTVCILLECILVLLDFISFILNFINIACRLG